MAFLGELLTYSFKYIVLGIVAVVAVICGVKYKKNKIAQIEAEAKIADIQETEN